MRRFAVVALLVAGFALPVCAQRGMSHGGFSGHFGGGFHSGFAAPQFSGGFSAPHYRFPGGLRYPARSSFSTYPGRYPYSYPGSMDANFRPAYARDGYRDRRYRRSYFYAYGAPVAYAVPEWVGLGPLGYYPDDFDYDDSAASSDQPGAYQAQGYEPQPEEQEQPVYREEYEPSVEAPSPPSQVPASENATTIIFKNGRPSEQIHNYALTRTTLYVLDQRHQDIPLDQVDLAATEKANRDAGIEFRVPQTIQMQ